MAGFRKAKAEQAYLKMGLYGPPGSGKTFTALLIAEGLSKLSGKRIAYVDTERGTDFYSQRVAERKIHPEAFDFDALYSRSITEVAQGVYSLDMSTTGIVVLDSITHIWQACMEAYEGKMTKAGTIPISAWGNIKRPYKDLVGYLLNLPAHVIICGRQGNEFDTDEESGQMKKVGVKMKAEGETAYEPHILIRMEQERDGNGGFRINAIPEKDRTGLLTGKIITMQESETFAFDNLVKPLLPLLGETQAKMKSTAQNANEDAEALTEESVKKIEMSKGLLDDMVATIQLCKTQAQIEDLGKKITPDLKSMMTSADVATLREAYLEAKKKLK